METPLEKSLENGFALECQAVQRYLVFSRKAEEEANKNLSPHSAELLKETSTLFRQIAEQEKSHALSYLSLLGGVDQTRENLAEAIAGEKSDVVEYTVCAATARAEGRDDLALEFEKIAAIEKKHVEQFESLLLRLQNVLVDDRLGTM
jgi:rubrerythrin